MIPYGKHSIDQSDIDAVVSTLKSDWLTTGKNVVEFERAISLYTGSRHAVAVSSGTAALHCAVYAVGIKPGDEIIVPAMTFAATANCVIAMGATPIIVDVEADTLLIDPKSIEKKLTSKTKAIISVDYAGQPCDYSALRELADRHHLFLISDSCHALGAEYADKPIPQIADLSVFSFHPVKLITTGEGGAIATNDNNLEGRARRFRNHGIDADLHQRKENQTWMYNVVDLGFNYRITDFQCALGVSQLKKADRWVNRRREIALKYDRAFASLSVLKPLAVKEDSRHVYHLYVVRLEKQNDQFSRLRIFTLLRKKGIGVNVHYIPLTLHPYYQQRRFARVGQCPVAEAAYEKILSLPVYPGMKNEDVDFVIDSIQDVFS